MKSFKFVTCNTEVLLCAVNSGVYATTVVDRGVRKITFNDGSILGLAKANGSEVYYQLDSKREHIFKVVENISEARLVNAGNKRYLFYQRENEYFVMDLSDMTETALGSWKFKNVFFSGKEGEVTLRFLTDEGLETFNYVSVAYYQNSNMPVFACLRLDGLYDLWFEACQLQKLETGKYVRFTADEIAFNCSMIFCYDEQRNGYELIFSGRNLTGFNNAVLEEVASPNWRENSRFLFYYFNDREKVLLCATSPEDEVSYSSNEVVINGTSWGVSTESKKLLNPVGVDLKALTETKKDEKPEEKEAWWKICFGW